MSNLPSRGKIVTTEMSATMEPLLPEEGMTQHPCLSLKEITDLIACKSPLLRGWEATFVEIENILTELHLLLNAAEAMKESNEMVRAIVFEMEDLRSIGEETAGRFVDERKRQSNWGWFTNFFPRDRVDGARLQAEIQNLRHRFSFVKGEATSIGIKLVDANENIQSEAQSLPPCGPSGPSYEVYIQESDIIGPDISGATQVVIPIDETKGISETTLARLPDNEGNPTHGTAGISEVTLPSYLAQCLFYLGLFPEDYHIPARKLINLWVAEGLVLKDYYDESPEVTAEKYLSKLIEKNMIQAVKRKVNGRVKTCRMHDACRDLWVTKGRETFFLQAQSIAQASSSSGAVEIRRLADHLDPKDDSYSHIHGHDRPNNSSFRSYYENLHTLVSFDWRKGIAPGKEIGDFIQRGIANRCFQGMCVLDLERVFRPNLPESLGKLIHLTYLGLRWTYLQNLPSSIFNLFNLQTLDLKHTYIRTLPSSFWKMQRLRQLYLSESCRTRLVPPRDTSSLTDLQTLWGAFFDKESKPVKSLFRSTKLRKLGITCQLDDSQQEATAAWISRLGQLESLRLISIDSSGKPSKLLLHSLSRLFNLSRIYLLGKLVKPIDERTFPESLTELTLSFSRLVVAPMHILGKLPNLEILRLLSDAYVGTFMLWLPYSFPALRVLNLWKLKQLKTLTLGKDSLPFLKELEIRSCTALKTFPDGLQDLKSLRELKLKDMPEEFTSRVREVQGEDWYNKHVSMDEQSQTNSKLIAQDCKSSSCPFCCPVCRVCSVKIPHVTRLQGE